MDHGKVKWFSQAKGYGFIEREGEEDLFVHHTSIQSEGLRGLYEGEQVTYDIAQGEKGPMASNVVSMLRKPLLSSSRPAKLLVYK